MDPRGVKVVVRYADGRFTKGKTYDFQVGRPRFHVFADPRISDALPVRVDMSDLKAVFFVRDLAGPHTDRGEFPENRPMGPRSPFRAAVTSGAGERGAGLLASARRRLSVRLGARLRSSSPASTPSRRLGYRLFGGCDTLAAGRAKARRRITPQSISISSQGRAVELARRLTLL